MAVSRLSTQSIQQSFPKGNTFWDGTTATGAMDAISFATITTAQPVIEFTNIPQTYSHLQLRIMAATTRSDAAYADLTLRFNSDTANNYSYQTFIGDPRPYISVDAAASTSSVYLGGIMTGTGYAGLSSSFTGSCIVDILNYASTSNVKTVRAIGGSDRNGVGNSSISGNVGMSSGAWYNTSTGVNSIRINSPYNFTVNSVFSLYGIR